MYGRILQVQTFILYSEKSILWAIINMEVMINVANAGKDV